MGSQLFWETLFPFKRQLVKLDYGQADLLFQQALNLKKSMSRCFILSFFLILAATYNEKNGSMLATVFYGQLFVFSSFWIFFARHRTVTSMATLALSGARGKYDKVDSILVMRATRQGWAEWVYMWTILLGLVHPLFLAVIAI